MQSDELVALLKLGPERWNEWRKKDPRTEYGVGSEQRPVDLIGVDLQGADLTNLKFNNVDLSGADLRRTDLRGVSFVDSKLQGAKLSAANLCKAQFLGTDLTDATIKGADFYQAEFQNMDFAGVKGAHEAFHLDTTLATEIKNFDQSVRRWPEKWLDWERFRTIGHLPLFTASYSVLLLIPLFFYGLAFYNSKVEVIQNLANVDLARDTPPWIAYLAAHLKKQPIPSQSLLALFSAFCLGIASTLYTFFCPSRVKEFSRDQWCDQLKNPLIHYWPQAWQYRWIRLFSAVFYLVGGAGALWVIGTKIWRAGVFIYQNS